jgi:putative transposase
MNAAFCVDALQDTLSLYGAPEIFNSDQGSKFTSSAFTGLLKQTEVQINMDGRGRAFDNIFVERLWRTVKYEDVYLRGYSSLGELTAGLSDYFQFYNAERPHQSLDNQTPMKCTATGKVALRQYRTTLKINLSRQRQSKNRAALFSCERRDIHSLNCERLCLD